MPDESAYQMLWDCPACDTPKLLGLTHRHCPACGSPQDPASRYFPPEGEEIAVEDHQYAGADRVCGACDTPSAAIAEFCGGCGSPMDDAKEARRRTDQVAEAGQSFESDDAKGARSDFKA